MLRDWYADRGVPRDRLLVPSFVLGDPWRTIAAAAVPYWTFFAVQPALRALEAHLAARRTVPVRSNVLLFQHGVMSPGVARPDEWLAVARRHGARGLVCSPWTRAGSRTTWRRSGATDRALAGLPAARSAWTPLDVDAALRGLARAGVEVHGRARPPTQPR